MQEKLAKSPFYYASHPCLSDEKSRGNFVLLITEEIVVAANYNCPGQLVHFGIKIAELRLPVRNVKKPGGPNEGRCLACLEELFPIQPLMQPASRKAQSSH